MRETTAVEREMQADTIRYLKRHFIFVNTDPMPFFETDGDTIYKVHAIRYSGLQDGPNRFGL